MKKIAIAFASLLFAAAAFAQTPQERKDVVEKVAKLLETTYVVPEKGRELAARVRKANYDSATSALELAKLINRELEPANDRHLGIRTGLESGRRMVPGSAPAATAEMLEGNIGYLRVPGFSTSDEALDAMSRGMAQLAGAKAVIVDVRSCPGGAADSVSYLASYFFGPDRRVLMNRYDRRSDTSHQSTTVGVPGRRMPETPLFILTSPMTASACESFAFTLQQWGRAKVVGEKSAGAGYNNTIVDVGHGLMFSISYGTAIHPKTQKQFEAVGVQPDIAVAADRALDAARAAALGKPIPANAADEVRALERQWLDAYEKRDGRWQVISSRQYSAESLQDYAGTYGVREITVRDGNLYYQRIGGHGGTLKAIAHDQFDLAGDVVVTFQRDNDGKVTSMRIQWKDGRSETAARVTTPPAP